MSQNNGALGGLKVLDASRVLGGPIAGQILGDHGAEVIKVEGPAGDDTRKWGPPYLGNQAAYFSGANRNKTSITLDLSKEGDRHLFFEMLNEADVLLENFKPSTLAKWGIGLDDFLTHNPRLIHCRVSGFGSEGPYGGLPAYDTAIQALCGLMSVNGDVQSGPMRVGLPIVDMTTGLNAVIGVLLALFHREKTGEGQQIEVTLYASAISLLHPHAPNYFSNQENPKRTGNAHPNIYPYDCFDTKTIPVYLAIGNDVQFKQFCNHINLSSLVDDPLFKTNPDRSVNRHQLRDILQKTLKDMDGKELVNMLLQRGVPCAPVNTVADILTDSHTEHMQLIVELGASYRGLASPIQLSRTPATYRLEPPAQL